MKKVFLPIAGVALFIVVVGFLTKYAGQGNLSLPSGPKQPDNLLMVGGQNVRVRVADTDSERRKGLSGTSSLPEDEGVLFVFEKMDTRPGFWMKEMQMAIDILWINDGRVVQIDRNAQPEPGVADNQLRIYRPTSEVDYVLEVNAGWSDRVGVAEGNTVENLAAVLKK